MKYVWGLLVLATTSSVAQGTEPSDSALMEARKACVRISSSEPGVRCTDYGIVDGRHNFILVADNKAMLDKYLPYGTALAEKLCMTQKTLLVVAYATTSSVNGVDPMMQDYLCGVGMPLLPNPKGWVIADGVIRKAMGR